MSAPGLLRYQLRRDGAEAVKTLCDHHLGMRLGAGWTVVDTKLSHVLECADCATVKEGAVIDRIIAQDEKPEPKPAPVLPGQRRLFP